MVRGCVCGGGGHRLLQLSLSLLLLQVFTVEEMMPHLQDVKGAVTKNLFLKDKKKKGLWLVSARHDRQVSSSTRPLTSNFKLKNTSCLPSPSVCR